MKKNLLLLLVSLFVSCLVAEVIFRLKGSYESYQERSSGGKYVSPFQTRSQWGYGWTETPLPYSQVKPTKGEYNYSWTANNEGLRGDSIKLAKIGTRIAVFGDSFTESMGAPNDSTYPRLLQNLITSSGDTTTEVVNCGAGGADVFTEYKLLTGKILKYKPDVVILTFNSTDLYEYTIRGGFERFKPNNQVQYRTPPWFEPIYAKSFFVRMLVHDLFNYDYRFLNPSEAAAMDSLSVKNVIAALDSFKQTCSARKIKFGMVFHPMYGEYNKTQPDNNAPIIIYCMENDIPFIDNTECMQQNGVTSKDLFDYYWRVDAHYKAKGYLLLANCVYDFLQQQGWLSYRHAQSAPQL